MKSKPQYLADRNRLHRLNRRRRELISAISNETEHAIAESRTPRNGDDMSAQINRINTRIKQLSTSNG